MPDGKPRSYCRCGLARHALYVYGPLVGKLLAYTCEHCDTRCDEDRCRLCTASRATVS